MQCLHNSSLLDEIFAHREEIRAKAFECGLCEVRVYGSVARRQDDSKSDIDLLVKHLRKGDPLGFLTFKKYMESKFHRKVDITFETTLHHTVRAEVYAEAKEI